MTQIYLNAETFGQNPIKKIACGKSHCLILMRNGRIYVFGDNDQGQLGLPLVMKTISNLTQVEVIGGNQEDIEDIACGDYFSLVLSIDSLFHIIYMILLMLFYNLFLGLCSLLLYLIYT